MAVVTLAEAKAHLRVDQSAEDSTIQIYVDAADDYICNFLNQSPPPQSASIKAAALLLVGDMYQNRESQIVGASVAENVAVKNLLYPYRVEIGI